MTEDRTDRWMHLCELLGEVPTDVLIRKARELFPELIDDPAQRRAFGEHLRFVAESRRQVIRTPEEVAELNALNEARAAVYVDGELVGMKEPAPERTVEDVLSEAVAFEEKSS